jgi:DNA-binding XRE family transcriptional regulator
MATTATEDFDLETFRNLVGKFDSNQAGGGDAAFRKAVILCTKYGLGFSEAAAMAFGQGDGNAAELEAENAELRAEVEQRKQGGDELADALGHAKQTIAALEHGQERGEHQTEIKALFRHAWEGPHFRLVRLTLMIAAVIMAAGITEEPMFSSHPLAAWFLLIVTAYLFGSWSVALFRTYGFAQMLMKWVVYCSVVGVGCMALPPSPVLLMVLLVAMVLTFSRLNEWLGKQVRMKVWESSRVRVVRAWF